MNTGNTRGWQYLRRQALYNYQIGAGGDCIATRHTHFPLLLLLLLLLLLTSAQGKGGIVRFLIICLCCFLRHILAFNPLPLLTTNPAVSLSLSSFSIMSHSRRSGSLAEPLCNSRYSSASGKMFECNEKKKLENVNTAHPQRSAL